MAVDGTIAGELRTLVHVSTTEHDLDAAPVDHAADEEFGGERGSEPIDADTDLEMGFDDVADIDVLGDDDLELDPDDVDVPARAQDIDIADDDDLELDDVEGRLGSFDAFLAEAQADHVDGAETDPSYQLPRVVTSTDLDVADVEGLADDREPVEPDEPDVSGDVLEELRRANIDGPTVRTLPHDEPLAPHRQLKRSPEYDPAPMPIPLNLPRMLGRKPRVRRVTRVVRHVDPWSVFKIAIIANLLIYVIVLVAGVLLWNVAYATGTVDNVERFFESFGWSSFEFNGGEIYHSGVDGRPVPRDRLHRAGRPRGHHVQPDHRPGGRHAVHRARGGGRGNTLVADAPVRRAALGTGDPAGLHGRIRPDRPRSRGRREHPVHPARLTFPRGCGTPSWADSVADLPGL